MLTMEAYLDNSATTRCSEAAKNKMVEALTVDFGNPSSMHMKGVEAEKYVKEAATAIAKTLRCQDKEIVFTSGGTESNNLAIIGTALANQRAGKHIITTSVEHASVKNTMRFLEEEGFEITYLPVDANGQISLEQLQQELREDTILVSMMMVNNEIGALEPIAEAGKIIKDHNPATVFHVDAIQAFRSFRNGCILICFLSVDIRFTDRKVLDSYISKTRPRFVRFPLAEISRRACVPEPLMCRELQVLVWQLQKRMRIWRRMWNTCMS